MLKSALCALALTIAANPGFAEPATDSSFTFKRVKPPAAGTSRRITIQIAPVEEESAVLPNVPKISRPATVIGRKVVEPVEPRPGAHASWFWNEISPRIGGTGSTKLALAMKTLLDNPTEAARLRPSAERITTITETYGETILEKTAGTQVSPALVVAVIAVESAGKPKAKSHAGAVGLMQLMPATARRFGVTDRTNPAQNIGGGVAYLDFLLKEFDGDAVMALAAYNAGEGAVNGRGGVPNYEETRHYVPKVVAAWMSARERCLAPPMRATDGCLFTGIELARQ